MTKSESTSGFQPDSGASRGNQTTLDIIHTLGVSAGHECRLNPRAVIRNAGVGCLNMQQQRHKGHGDQRVEVHIQAVEQPAEPGGHARLPLCGGEVAQARRSGFLCKSRRQELLILHFFGLLRAVRRAGNRPFTGETYGYTLWFDRTVCHARWLARRCVSPALLL